MFQQQSTNMDDLANLHKAMPTFEQKLAEYAANNRPVWSQENRLEIAIHYGKAYCYADRDMMANKTVNDLRWYIIGAFKWVHEYGQNSAIVGQDAYNLKLVYERVAQETSYPLATELVISDSMPSQSRVAKLNRGVNRTFNVGNFDTIIKSTTSLSIIRMVDIITNYIGFVIVYFMTPILTPFMWLNVVLGAVMVLLILPVLSYTISFAERAFLDAWDAIVEAKNSDNYVYKDKAARKSADILVNYVAAFFFGLVFLVDIIMSAVPLIVSLGAPWGWFGGIFLTVFIEWVEFKEFKEHDKRKNQSE